MNLNGPFSALRRGEHKYALTRSRTFANDQPSSYEFISGVELNTWFIDQRHTSWSHEVSPHRLDSLYELRVSVQGQLDRFLCEMKAYCANRLVKVFEVFEEDHRINIYAWTPWEKHTV